MAKGKCKYETEAAKQPWCILKNQFLSGSTCEGCPDKEATNEG
jgi:hypothetical protein